MLNAKQHAELLGCFENLQLTTAALNTLISMHAHKITHNYAHNYTQNYAHFFAQANVNNHVRTYSHGDIYKQH